MNYIMSNVWGILVLPMYAPWDAMGWIFLSQTKNVLKSDAFCHVIVYLFVQHLGIGAPPTL